MVIKFTMDQLDDPIADVEESLAFGNWNRLKEQYPELSKKYFNDEEKKGVDFLIIAQTRVKQYLKSVEENEDYNKWRLAYAEICFVENNNKLDESQWVKSLLEEKLWPPFLAIDILTGVIESCSTNPDSQKFYHELERKKWD